jgi:signal transduction histidine kinase
MKNLRFLSSLFFGLVIVLVCIYGFALLRHRPGFPPDIDRHRLVRVDDLKIETPRDPDFILLRKEIGDSVTCYLKSDAGIYKIETVIIPYYRHAPFPLFYFFIGLFCLFIGFAVFILRREEPRALIFYWMSLAFSSALIISGGFEVVRGHWQSLLPGILFYGIYPLAPALLLHFTLSFPGKKSKLHKFMVYIPALLFAGIFLVSFLLTILCSSLPAHRFYHSVYPYFRLYTVLYIFFSILLLSRSYRRSRLAVEKAQIKWIFYGMIVGLLPFALLYQLPQTFRLKPFISEELANVFFLAVPVALAISIVRYKLMNITMVINRSLVYSLLTIFVMGVYLFAVQILRDVFSHFFMLRESMVSLAGALLAAALFHPARTRIQRWVDRLFFRQVYDYRKTIRTFNEEAQKIIDTAELVDFYRSSLARTLPLEHISVHFSDSSLSGRRPRRTVEEGSVPELLSAVGQAAGKILARKRAVQTEDNMDFSKEDLLDRKKIDLIIPLIFQSSAVAGCAALGKKKSGARFTWEDLELLRTLSGELALNVERIRLQEEVIYERASNEKLDELNRLKTEFISGVSHELRTPMTTLQGLAETLQTGKIRNKARREELLGLLASEICRLSRFLHNILDFGKIEQKTMTYQFREIAAQPLIEEVMQFYAACWKSGGFHIKKEIPKKTVFLRADPDALKQALINLLDNATKYSTDRKEIGVHVIETKREVEIRVNDRGIGIPSEDLTRIFEKFFRTPDASARNPQGVGIGLKIVRDIMDAHHGQIKVESEPNRGTSFRLVFPKP